MKTIKKRILALWMAVCMALTMMPSMAIPVLAAEDSTLVTSIQVGEHQVLTPTRAGETMIEESSKLFECNDTEVTPSNSVGGGLSIKVKTAKEATVYYAVRDEDPTQSDDVNTPFGTKTSGQITASVSSLSTSAKTVYFKVVEGDSGLTTEYFKLTLNIKDKAAKLTATATALSPGEQNTVYLKVTEDSSEATNYKYKVVESPGSTDGEPFYAGDDASGLDGYTDATKAEIKEDGHGVKVTNAVADKVIEVYGVDDEQKIKSYGKITVPADDYVEAPEFENNSVEATDTEHKSFELVLSNVGKADKYKIYTDESSQTYVKLDGNSDADNVTVSDSNKLKFKLNEGISRPSQKVYIVAVKSDKESARTEVILNEHKFKQGAEIVKITEDASLFEEKAPGQGGTSFGGIVEVPLKVPYKNPSQNLTIKLELSEGATAAYSTTRVTSGGEINTPYEKGSGIASVTVTHGKITEVYVKVSSEGDDNQGFYKLVISMVDPETGAEITSYTVDDSTEQSEIPEIKEDNNKDHPAELTAKVPYAMKGKKATVNFEVSENAALYTGDAAGSENAEAKNGSFETKDLSESENVVYIKVVSEDEETETYYKLTITLEPASKDARIDSLTVAGYEGKAVAEDDGKGTDDDPILWTVTVPKDTKLDNPDLSVTVKDDTASEVKYQVNESWSSGTLLSVHDAGSALWKHTSIGNVSSTPVFIKVTAENTEKTLTYKVTINKDEELIVDTMAPELDLGEYSDALGETLKAEKFETDAISDEGFADALLEVTQKVIDNPDIYDKEAAKEALDTEDPVYIHVIPSLEITVEDYNIYTNTERLLLDITPVYTVVASTEENVSDVAPENSVKLGEQQPQKLEISDEVTVKLPIEKKFADEDEYLFVKLGNDKFTQKCQVTSGTNNQYIEIKFPHFSQVEITKKHGVAELNEKIYDSLEEAVAAIGDASSATITLYSKPEKAVTVNQVVEITLAADDLYTDAESDNEELKSILVAGGMVRLKGGATSGSIESDNLKFEFEANPDAKYPITINCGTGGSVTTEPENEAAENARVNLTVTSNEGYVLNTLTVMETVSGEVVETSVVDGKDGFTMPKAAVTITASFRSTSTTPGGSTTPPAATTGNLTVSKTVTGDEGDKTKDFNFTVTLGDTSITGTYGSMVFANGVSSFKLKHNQSVTANDLPANISYSVVEAEENQDGYTTTSANASGTITAGATATAAFTNKKGEVEGGDEPTPPPAGDDTIKFSSEKQQSALLNRTTGDANCELKLEAVDGEDIGSLTDWTITSSNTDVVSVTKNNTLRYEGVGEATVTVVATGKNGNTYTITFPVKVVKPGTPTFTLSHCSSKKARTFTVTTSTIRGATGFQVKYSLKKSLKSSKTKTYACGKKLIRKTIKANKSKRTYYVRVRAYQTVDGKRVYGAWSKLTKTIKSK